MKLALIIVFTIGLLAFVLFYFTTDRPTDAVQVNLPWQVIVHDAEHSEVFGIVLNQTTLEQARQHFGQLDGLALFKNEQGEYSLEAYFGKVTIGPFSARLIANLDVPQDELERLTEHSVKRITTQQGSVRWTLTPQKQTEQGLQRIRSLTYIPGYSGMDAAFIEQRFGTPGRRKSVDETTELWFYPQQGVRIMIDSEGKEMFEYSAPAQFETSLGD